MAFIITASILFLLFLLMSVWVVETIKALLGNGHGEEDEESCIESKYPQMALFFAEQAAFPSAPTNNQSTLPPLNPGATYSHPPLPLSSSVSHATDISVAHSEDCLPSQAQSASLATSLPPLNLGSTHSHSSLPPINDDDDDSVESIFYFDYYFKSQAPSPVDPTPVAEDDSEKYLLPLEGLQVVVTPKLFTAPIIILSPPSPKKKKRGTKKKERRTKLPISLSPSAPAPLQTLSPKYNRVFPRRERKSIPHPTPQASAQVNTTISPPIDSEDRGPDNRVLAEVVLRPTVSTAPVISISPPSPKKNRGTKTENSIKFSTSLSALQNLTPDYHRDFTSRIPTATHEVVDKENIAPLAVVSKRKSSSTSREEQLKVYIPPCYLLAQRCIDIVHSRSARHAWVDEMLYGEPRKF